LWRGRLINFQTHLFKGLLVERKEEGDYEGVHLGIFWEGAYFRGRKGYDLWMRVSNQEFVKNL